MLMAHIVLYRLRLFLRREEYEYFFNAKVRKGAQPDGPARHLTRTTQLFREQFEHVILLEILILFG